MILVYFCEYALSGPHSSKRMGEKTQINKSRYIDCQLNLESERKVIRTVSTLNSLIKRCTSFAVDSEVAK